MNKSNRSLQCTIELCELKTREDPFERIFIEAVDESFSLFGQSNQEAIYSFIEKAYGIGKKEIPHKIKAFSEALHQCFGSGAKTIEMHIIKALHEKNLNFKYFHRKGDVVLEEYAENLKLFLTYLL